MVAGWVGDWVFDGMQMLGLKLAAIAAFAPTPVAGDCSVDFKCPSIP
jgi:hypothetical protein